MLAAFLGFNKFECFIILFFVHALQNCVLGFFVNAFLSEDASDDAYVANFKREPLHAQAMVMMLFVSRMISASASGFAEPINSKFDCQNSR